MESLEKQKLLINYLVGNPDLFVLCNGIVKTSYFDPSLRKSVSFLLDYFNTYKSVPNPEQVKAETGIQFEKKQLTKPEFQYASDEIERFCRNNAIQNAILESVKLLEQEDFGKMESSLKEAISVSLNKDLGTDYFKDPEARLNKTITSHKPIPTGWPELDEEINGGLIRQEIILFMANSGVGKSIMLTNLAANVVKEGYNVLYITLELSEDVVAKRFDSMLTKVPQKEILSSIPQVTDSLSHISENAGRLFIKRMPESTTNANHIRAYVKEFERSMGFLPDVLVIDYIDIMTTNHKIPVDNLFVKDKYITEECRSLGFDFDCAILSASQMGRKALEDGAEIDQSFIQGGISKVNTADFLIAILQSDQMRAAGEYALQIAKARNAGSLGHTILLGWDAITLSVYSLLNKKNSLQFNKKDKPRTAMPSTGTVFDGERKNANDLLKLIR